MAASYQTGTAISPTNLLQTIVSWLVAQGWTSDASASEGTGWRAHLHKSGQYVNLRAAMNELIIPWVNTVTAGYAIGCNLGSSYSSGASWGNQPGSPDPVTNIQAVGMNLPAGNIVAYHFFDDGADNITIVVEKIAGRFVYMGWGKSMTKVGFSSDYWYFHSSTPAYLLTSTSTSQPGNDLPAGCPMGHNHNYGGYELPTSYIRLDAAVFPSRWVSMVPTYNGTPGYIGGFCASAVMPGTGDVAGASRGQYPTYDVIRSRLISVAFQRALVLPIHCFFQNQSTLRWLPLGYPPSVFYCTAAGNGFSVGQVLAIGGLNYKLFPYFAVLKAA
jgi:hypothetical protein